MNQADVHQESTRNQAWMVAFLASCSAYSMQMAAFGALIGDYDLTEAVLGIVCLKLSDSAVIGAASSLALVSLCS